MGFWFRYLSKVHRPTPGWAEERNRNEPSPYLLGSLGKSNQRKGSVEEQRAELRQRERAGPLNPEWLRAAQPSPEACISYGERWSRFHPQPRLP